MADDSLPLRGFTIGVTAARRSEELGTMLVRRGAAIVYAPALRIIPLADDAELRDATRRCLESPVDYVAASTGIGFRGWMEAAHDWGVGAELVQQLQAGALFARGPKAIGAMRAAGLDDPWSPPSESSPDLLARLLQEPLSGRRIVVQQHGAPMPEFTDALRSAGAEVIEISVYRWEPPEDLTPLRQLTDKMLSGRIDAVTFTSAPAIDSLLEAAGDRRDELIRSMRDTVVAACVGPVCAEPLRQLGIDSIVPERYRLGAMVRALTEQLPALRAGAVTSPTPER